MAGNRNLIRRNSSELFGENWCARFILWAGERSHGPQGYKTFILLNWTEHEISIDHKISDAEK